MSNGAALPPPPAFFALPRPLPDRPPLPADEAARVAALRGYEILDTAIDDSFELLTEITAEVTGCPLAFINFVDSDRVWTKSAHGKPRGELPREQDYCAYAIVEDRLWHVEDLRADPRTRDLDVTHERGYRMYAGANVVTPEGLSIGTLCVIDWVPRRLSARQLALLERMAEQVTSLLELRRHQRELLASHRALNQLASTDTLTGLANRRGWDIALRRELARCQRHGTPLAVAVIDIDHFKRINDEHGHAAGDAVLAAIGRLLAAGFRGIDTVARIGGEEFAALLVQTHLAQAAEVCERLRRDLGRLQVPHEGQLLGISASIGVAALGEGAGRRLGGSENEDNSATLLRRADRRVYAAKQAGRNRVVISG